MPKMHWKLSLILWASCLVVFFVWDIFKKRPATADSSSVSAIVEKKSPAPIEGPNKVREDFPLSTKKSIEQSFQAPASQVEIEKAKTELLRKYACSSPRCDESTTAKSLLEAAWLEKAGYPTQEQLSRYKFMPLSALEAEARRSPAMRALYAHRLLDLGQQVQAAEQATRSIAEGCVYGLYELSNVYSSPGILNSRESSLAVLRIASMLGDSQAMEVLYNKADSLDEMHLADRQAAAMFPRILWKRVEVAGTGLSSSPRPFGDNK